MSGVGIVVALASEASALTSRKWVPGEIFGIAPGVDAALCGMGAAAAGRAAQRLVELGASALVVFGVAGALSDNFIAGDLVCPVAVVDEHGRRYATDAEWRAREFAGQDSVLLSVSTVLTTPAEKSLARARFHAHAVDMESAAVAAVAKAQRLPLLVVRAIADDAATAIPPVISSSVDAYGRPRPLALLGGLLRNPSAVFALPRLAASMNRALSALSAIAEKSGPAFGYQA